MTAEPSRDRHVACALLLTLKKQKGKADFSNGDVEMITARGREADRAYPQP
jgi:hypothetical protein